VFTGATPHIDERLAHEGRLRWIRTSEEYEAALADRTPTLNPPRAPYPRGMESILNTIQRRLEETIPGRARKPRPELAKTRPEPAQVLD
jgi:hypothetical protein